MMSQESAAMGNGQVANPDSNMAGRVVVVTGATGAIGKEIALGLAAKGAELVLAARNVPKAQAVAKEITAKTKNSHIRVEQVDLCSPTSISGFAARLSSQPGGVDVLINNAAVVPPNKVLTSDGIELQFATNVLSYFLLSTLLRPLLKNSAKVSKKSGGGPARIINVASQYAGGLDLNDVNFDRRRYNANSAYRQTKQADRMLSWAAAERFEEDGIIVHACHPGVVTSTLLNGLGFGMGFDRAATAASTPIFLASAPAGRLGTGRYWKSSKALQCQFAADKKAQDALWERCASMCDSVLRSGSSTAGSSERKECVVPKLQSEKKKPTVSL
mmetsp:Transcript_19125/g.36848  ORF Transcript_19125/g.36848 Transcript_19125/m.36848 type:complete len:330 (-) Transcript_19125:216-1205(-)